MEFKIVRVSDGEILFRTTSESCIPEESVLRDMLKNGMKAYMNGKVWKFGKENK